VSRTLSLNLREAMFGQESSEVIILLLTITHADLAEPIYLSTDATERYSDAPLLYRTMSRGTAFLYAGISVTLPDEQDKTPPACKLTIQNVSRDLIPLARSVDTPPQVVIEAVLASAPDLVEMTWPVLDMSNLVADASTLQFDLTMDALVTEPFPADTFSPSQFPGLFF
jgi:hypothetical protein